MNKQTCSRGVFQFFQKTIVLQPKKFTKINSKNKIAYSKKPKTKSHSNIHTKTKTWVVNKQNKKTNKEKKRMADNKKKTKSIFGKKTKNKI